MAGLCATIAIPAHLRKSLGSDQTSAKSTSANTVAFVIELFNFEFKHQLLAPKHIVETTAKMIEDYLVMACLDSYSSISSIIDLE